MYDDQTALKQEWAVFCALAPQELLDRVQTPNLDHEKKGAIETMFIQLGFFELALEYYPQKDTCQVIRDALERREYDTRDLLRLFMDNIHSEDLHHLFDQRVGYLY